MNERHPRAAWVASPRTSPNCRGWAALDSACCPAWRERVLTVLVTQRMWSLGKHLSPSLGPEAWAAVCVLGPGVIWIINAHPQ